MRESGTRAIGGSGSAVQPSASRKVPGLVAPGLPGGLLRARWHMTPCSVYVCYLRLAAAALPRREQSSIPGHVGLGRAVCFHRPLRAPKRVLYRDTRMSDGYGFRGLAVVFL